MYIGDYAVPMSQEDVKNIFGMHAGGRPQKMSKQTLVRLNAPAKCLDLANAIDVEPPRSILMARAHWLE